MRFFSKKLYQIEEQGATGIEYSLIAAGVSLAIIFIVFIFGDSLYDLFIIVQDVLLGINSQS